MTEPVKKRGRSVRRVTLAGSLALCTVAAAASGGFDGQRGGVYDSMLAFDPNRYTTIHVTIDGQVMPVRWYKEVCYVAQPQLMAATQAGFGGSVTIANPQCGYQSMNIFVPDSAVDDGRTAIYLQFNNAGKAPTVVVDAKAAVRYLRLNDETMPGSAERIVVNGTSGGGALVSALGASGNSDDFLPLLNETGAAGVGRHGRSTLRDDVFAVVSYCPITDLGNANAAYEWMYTVFGTREAVNRNNDPAGSAEMAAQFADYQRGLRLRNQDGRRLTADNMLDELKAEVIRSAETFMKAGGTIPDLGATLTYPVGGVPTNFVNDWIDVDNDAKKVVSLDMQRYLKFVASQAVLKAAPAFDNAGVATFPGGMSENTLFGTPHQAYLNFSEYAWNNNSIAGDSSGRDDTGYLWRDYERLRPTSVDDQVRLINPMRYIGSPADAAPYWYVRHGTRDRDTSFTVSINLSRALQADHRVRDLDYRLAWDQPHAGNYDVPEAMQWIADALKSAGKHHGRR